MLDHITLNVSNYQKSKAFYQEVLKTININYAQEYPEYKIVGFSNKQIFMEAEARQESITPFWIVEKAEPFGTNHVAFKAKTRQEVNDFYNKDIELGAKDNGKPGLRPSYHKNYYAAFLYDLDGHNIEAVCHNAE